MNCLHFAYYSQSAKKSAVQDFPVLICFLVEFQEPVGSVTRRLHAEIMLKDSQLPGITFFGMASLEVADGSSQQTTAGPRYPYMCVLQTLWVRNWGKGCFLFLAFLRKIQQDYYFQLTTD